MMWAVIDAYLVAKATTNATASANIGVVDRRDLLLLESAITAIDEAVSAVSREVERDRLGETSLARLSTVEAELTRSRLTLEKILQEEAV